MRRPVSPSAWTSTARAKSRRAIGWPCRRRLAAAHSSSIPPTPNRHRRAAPSPCVSAVIPALGSLDRWSASPLAASGWLRAVRSQVRTFQARYEIAGAESVSRMPVKVAERESARQDQKPSAEAAETVAQLAQIGLEKRAVGGLSGALL